MNFLVFNINNFYSNNINFTEVETLSAKTIVVGDIMQISNIFIETELLQASGSGTLNITTKDVYVEMVGQVKSTQDLINKYKKNFVATYLYISNYSKGLISDVGTASINFYALIILGFLNNLTNYFATTTVMAVYGRVRLLTNINDGCGVVGRLSE